MLLNGRSNTIFKWFDSCEITIVVNTNDTVSPLIHADADQVLKKLK